MFLSQKKNDTEQKKHKRCSIILKYMSLMFEGIPNIHGIIKYTLHLSFLKNVLKEFC